MVLLPLIFSDLFFLPSLRELPLYISAGLDPTASLVLWISLF